MSSSNAVLGQQITKGAPEDLPHLQAALLQNIWNLQSPNRADVSSLIEFYLARVNLIDQHKLIVAKHQDIVNIVHYVRKRSALSKRAFRDELRAAQPPWLSKSAGSEDAAFDLATRLWLLVDPVQFNSDENLSLLDNIKQQFPEAKSEVPLKEFEAHFNAESCKKVAGISIIGTSCLADHLRFDRREKVLLLFNLADFLNCVRIKGDENIYPPGLLLETKKTLALLHPQGHTFSSHAWQRKPFADIEMAVYENFSDLHDPNSYTYWRERLSALHEAYQKAQPGKLAQFWRDRRDTNQWTTLWLAVLVIFLTLFFGLIQSITGILQLILAYRQYTQQQPTPIPA